MKSYHANAGSGLAGLMLNEDSEPEPGLRELLVRMRANSLNFRELSILEGTYPLPVKPEMVMGADGAGEIVAPQKTLLPSWKGASVINCGTISVKY